MKEATKSKWAETIDLVHQLENTYGSLAAVPDDNSTLRKIRLMQKDVKSYRYRINDHGNVQYCCSQTEVSHFIEYGTVLLRHLHSDKKFNGITIRRGLWYEDELPPDAVKYDKC